MYSGLLSGSMTSERIAHLPDDDWRKRNPNFQEPLLSRNLHMLETLRPAGDRYNPGPGQAAVGWTLRNPAVTAAIVAVRTAKSVRGVVGAAWMCLSDADAAEIALPDTWRPEAGGVHR
jgi:aryl-alcohol dehydrogenase-like predicted oxidoreductase